jgi:arsenate reductase (thioredoxin)
MSGKPAKTEEGVPRTPAYIEAEKTVPVELRPVFAQLMAEYRFASFKHHGQPFASPKVIAELVCMGWRSPPAKKYLTRSKAEERQASKPHCLAALWRSDVACPVRRLLLEGVRKRVLFLCVKNSSRSQMAEALLRKMERSDLEAYSAGIKPAEEVNENAVTVMREVGYDLTSHRPKHACEVQKIKFDVVIKMDVPEPEICDLVCAKWIESWDIPDPANGGLEEFRKVRNILAERLRVAFAEHEAQRLTA